MSGRVGAMNEPRLLAFDEGLHELSVDDLEELCIQLFSAARAACALLQQRAPRRYAELLQAVEQASLAMRPTRGVQ